MILTSGTELSNLEYLYIRDALDKIGTEDFNYYVPRFAEEFAKYVGAKYAIPLTNGTNALFLATLALGIGKGDEVITPDLGYIVTANVIAQAGAIPVLVDIDPFTWTIDPVTMRKAITKKTKAIMPVWMYGNAPMMEVICNLADTYHLKIIEDACPAVGSYYRDKHAGTWGDVGCFSFQGAKLLAIGEGGMAVTNDKDVADKINKLATAGRSTTREFWHDEVGYMAKMSEIQGALGLGQLSHVDDLIAKKKQIHGWYQDILGDLNPNYEHAEPNYWMPSIIVNNRDKVRGYLKENGIDTRPFFYPISEMGFYKARYKTPHSYKIGHHGINLPSGVKLTKEQVYHVAEKVTDVWQD